MKSRPVLGNRIEIRGDHAVLFDSKGHEILVDLAGLERVRGHTWHVVSIRGQTAVRAKVHDRQVYLNRFLMDPPLWIRRWAIT